MPDGLIPYDREATCNVDRNKVLDVISVRADKLLSILVFVITVINIELHWELAPELFQIIFDHFYLLKHTCKFSLPLLLCVVGTLQEVGRNY